MLIAAQIVCAFTARQGNEAKAHFCNLLWGGYFSTTPLRAAKRRAKTLVSVRSDHLKPKSGAERPPKADQASSPQTRSAPRIAGRCISERGCLQHRSFILCKNRTGTKRVKTQPFWGSALSDLHRECLPLVGRGEGRAFFSLHCVFTPKRGFQRGTRDPVDRNGVTILPHLEQDLNPFLERG